MQAWENYFDILNQVVEKVKTTQKDNIMKAAQILADTTEKGGIIYGFGTGHSHLVVDDAASQFGAPAAAEAAVDVAVSHVDGCCRHAVFL